MTGIILAGGRNSRIGTDKAFLKFHGRNLVEIILGRLKEVFKEIIIVTNSPEKYEGFGCALARDLFPGKGSLGGLYTGLAVSRSKYSFVCACDMPFLMPGLIKYLSGNCAGADLTIPKTGQKYETLHAVYSKKCLPPIEEQLSLLGRLPDLKREDFRITNFFHKVRVKEIGEDILRQFDPELKSFININTEAEYRQALSLPENI